MMKKKKKKKGRGGEGVKSGTYIHRDLNDTMETEQIRFEGVKGTVERK